MGSSSGTNSKSPSMPAPQGSQTTPYGNATPFNPSWVSFLPDSVGADGRMPMASGLDESHLAAIRDRPAPPPLSAQPRDAASAGMLGGDREAFAKMMSQYNSDKLREKYRNMMLGGARTGTGSFPVGGMR